MSEIPPQIPQSPDRQELFELLSRQFDGDLAAAEAQRLAILESSDREAAERFRQQAGLVSCLLKGMSIGSSERLLFEAPGNTNPRATRGPEPVVRPQRSGAQRIVVGAVTSLLCAGLLMAVNRRQDTAESPMLAKLEVLHGTMEARGGSPSSVGEAAMMADGQMVPEAMAMPADVPPGVVPDVAAVANANVADAGGADSEDSMAADMQPLIQSADWNVVVVKINGKDRDQAMDQIQSIVQKAGLQLKGSAEPDESRWLGVVLTSNVAGHQEVVNAMESVGASNGTVAETPSANSQEAMFIAAARESLMHPTGSELHHGKVFVVLPSAPVAKGEANSIASNEKASAVKTPGAASSELVDNSISSAKGRVAKSARISTRAVPAVTLVVFEFSDAEKSGPNNSRQQI